MSKDVTGATGMFWIAAVALGIGMFVGLFYWMITSQRSVRHNPQQPNSIIWSAPARTPQSVLWRT